jgi:hypothetical protein
VDPRRDRAWGCEGPRPPRNALIKRPPVGPVHPPRLALRTTWESPSGPLIHAGFRRLEDVNDAFAAMGSGEIARSVIIF